MIRVFYFSNVINVSCAYYYLTYGSNYDRLYVSRCSLLQAAAAAAIGSKNLSTAPVAYRSYLSAGFIN